MNKIFALLVVCMGVGCVPENMLFEKHYAATYVLKMNYCDIDFEKSDNLATLNFYQTDSYLSIDFDSKDMGLEELRLSGSTEYDSFVATYSEFGTDIVLSGSDFNSNPKTNFEIYFYDSGKSCVTALEGEAKAL